MSRRGNCIYLLLAFTLCMQRTDGQRQTLQSVYGDSISSQAEDNRESSPKNATDRTWGNIFASRRKGGRGERGDVEAERGEMGREKGSRQKSSKGSKTKNPLPTNKSTGKSSQSSKGARNPPAESGKGKTSKKRSIQPDVTPSTQPDVSPSTVHPSTVAPSISPKQLEVNAPTDSPNGQQCDLELLDGFGLRNADCLQSLYDRIRAIDDLSITVTLIELLNLTGLIRCAVGLTFLLPTNAAWEAIDNDMIGQLLSSRGMLRDLFLYHVLPEQALSRDLVDGFRLTLLDGFQVLVGTASLSFDDSLVVVADQLACEERQVFHIVDQVLMPLLRRPQVSTQAPQQFPTFVPTSRIISSEIPTVSPTNDCSDFDFGGFQGTCRPNLLDTAKQDPTLSLVVSLFEVSGLQYIFDCPGPISAALPTNGTIDLELTSVCLHTSSDAIISLGKDVLDNLISSDQASLRELLLYHLFPGIVLSTGLSAGLFATLSGAQTVVVGIGPISFGGIEAKSLDNPHCNGGVYHKIGSVLDPAFVGLPSNSPSMAPTKGIPVEIRTGRFYMSFISESNTEPTAIEYEALRAAIEVYYYERSKEELSVSHPNAELLSLSLTLDITLHGADAVLSDFPSGRSLYNILRDGVTRRFLLDVIRVNVGTPFSEVIEASIRPI